MNAQEVEAAGRHTAESAARGNPEYASAASKSSRNFDRENTSQTARPNRQAVKRRLSVFPIELRKLLLQVGNFWQISRNGGTVFHRTLFVR
jgi:hypothetical protein